MGDKIDFNAALEDCKRVRDGIKSDEDFQNADSGLVMYYLNTIVQALEIATTVKRGHWITTQKTIDDNITTCSNCKREFYIEDLVEVGNENGYSEFCPSCGADMRGAT
jgi:hypothetical protein